MAPVLAHGGREDDYPQAHGNHVASAPLVCVQRIERLAVSRPSVSVFCNCIALAAEARAPRANIGKPNREFPFPQRPSTRRDQKAPVRLRRTSHSFQHIGKRASVTPSHSNPLRFVALSIQSYPSRRRKSIDTKPPFVAGLFRAAIEVANLVVRRLCCCRSRAAWFQECQTSSLFAN
jgi:hypothetical protein